MGRRTEKVEYIKMVEVQKRSKYRKGRIYENGRSTEKVEYMKMVEVQKWSNIWKWSKYRKGRSTEKVEVMRTQGRTDAYPISLTNFFGKPILENILDVLWPKFYNKIFWKKYFKLIWYYPKKRRQSKIYKFERFFF